MVKPNINCRVDKIYPIKGSKKRISELKTIGISSSREQAIHLARLILLATQDWEKIDLTAWRFKKRKGDKTYNLTVTEGY